MRNQLFLGVAVAALVMPAAASAQETTSTIRGTVTANGAPVSNAQVTVINVPSGTRSVTTTDAGGNYQASGLRVGGPFTVQVNSDQGNTSVTDIFTVAGQPFDVPVDLGSTAEDIVVTAASVSGAGTSSDGPQTVLTQEDIQHVASVNRDVRDIERRDPFATIDLANSRAVTFAGVNSRFNSFSVDGVAVQDTFGLNPDASPTRRGPVPFDAISQASVSIAPYDVRQGNFQGGAIDLILLSGTNEFHGTGFYSQNTDGLTGDRIGSRLANLAPFKSETYGATISGPIIKDKLFFMVSAERNKDPRPQSVTTATDVAGLTDATLAQVQGIASSKYGYDTGGIIGISPNKDEKIVGKIDFNITDGQRLSLTYINAYDSNYSFNGTFPTGARPGLGLASNDYQSTELLRSGVAQLNSDWTDNFSTEIRAGYNRREAGQTPLNGLGFSQFTVCTDPTNDATSTTACSTGTPTIVFGPDRFRQANLFTTDRYTGSVLARLTMGTHDLKLYGEYNATSVFNLFVADALGSYYFDSLADFQAGTASSVNYQASTSGVLNDAAAEFKYREWTFAVQDDWNVTDTFNLSYGIRYDLFDQSDLPPVNVNFVNRYGFANNKTFKGLGLPQPRISFNFKPNSTFSFRGGVGIFGGGTPDVYLGNSFSKTGVATNPVFVSRTATGFAGAPAAVAGAALTNVDGTAVNPALVNFAQTNTGSLALSETDAFDPSFDIPNLVKASLSGDYTPSFLGDGWRFGADFYYSKTRRSVQFTDIRSVVIGTLPDGRNRYGPLVAGDNSGNGDILLTNSDRGRSYVGDVRVEKTFDFGLTVGGSYTLQDVKDNSPATSSQAFSNYQNSAFLDPDFPAYGTSNDQTAWAFKYNLTFDHAFFGDYKTTFALFGETRAGHTYSFTMADAGSGSRSPVFGALGNKFRYLLYVPTGASDPIVSYDSPATQAALEDLINNTKLKDYRGKIAPRNIARSPANTKIDLHLEQQIPTFVGKSRISVFADIENVLNLINSDWGGLRQVPFSYVADVVRVNCLSAAGTVATSSSQPCASYQYSKFTPAPDEQLTSDVTNSLYTIRLGVRFTF